MHCMEAVHLENDANAVRYHDVEDALKELK